MKFSRHHNKHTKRLSSFYMDYIHDFYMKMLSNMWALELAVQFSDKSKWRIRDGQKVHLPIFLFFGKLAVMKFSMHNNGQTKRLLSFYHSVIIIIFVLFNIKN